MEGVSKYPGDNANGFHRNVPSSAAGPGYAPLLRDGSGSGGSDRWLDGLMLRKGDCAPYRGDACAQFLTGRHIKLMNDRLEEVYDAEREVLAAMLFIRKMPNVSEQCKSLSHQVACYHMFKVCDSAFVTSLSPSGVPNGPTISLCKEDCESLKNNLCPNEYAMADEHKMVGQGPKALLPDCQSLASTQRCLGVNEKQSSTPLNPIITAGESAPHATLVSQHWCYTDTGSRYQGTASTTRSNKPCLYWPQTTSSEFNTITHPHLRSAKNHCRNPSLRSKFREPWCYAVGPNGDLVEEACDIPRCPPNFHPQFTESSPEGDYSSQSVPFLDQAAGMWQSLSAQWQLLIGAGGISFLLLFLFLICCLCCCLRRRRAKKCGTHQSGSTQAQGTALESASSLVSSNFKHKQNLMLQHCNGGSTLANSEINNAYFRKIRNENGMRFSDEMMNPLIGQVYGSSTGMDHHHHMVPARQPQHFEMKQNYCGWNGAPSIAENDMGGTGTLNSGTGASYHHVHLGGSQYYPSAQHPSVQTYCSTAGGHTSSEQQVQQPPTEPYHLQTIQEQQLKFDKMIGEDPYSTLYLGEWVGGMISGATIQVAIRAVRPNLPQIALEQIKDEISTVGVHMHPNVVRLLGVSYLNQQNLTAVFDYMVHGDLVEFLKVREPRGSENDEKERIRNAEDFLRISAQIVEGMEYLAIHQQFVHRDLAARNCLVGDQQVIKIGDFARMKPQYENEYYKMNANVRVPLRWLSKEILNEGKYSHSSDTYAFGVTLWEIYTYAQRPYGHATDSEVIKLIQEETPLEIPEYCPPVIYGVILECQKPAPSKRPSFGELRSRFQKWCASAQSQALQMHQHRASSVHSGGSSSGINVACTIDRPPPNGLLPRCGRIGQIAAKGGHGRAGSLGLLNEDHQTVPSPAPNATILAGNLMISNKVSNGTGGQPATLTLLGNGTSIVHSTPISQKNHQPRTNRVPAAYTDEDAVDNSSVDGEYSSSEGDY